MRRLSRTAAAVAALALATAPLLACGGDDDEAATPTTAAEDGGGSDGGGDGATLQVLARDSLEFDRDAYDVEAGTITFVYENEGNSPHTLLIDDVDGLKLAVDDRGDVDEGAVELEPGEYELYCDVPGHRGGGMEATLTVE